MNMKWVTIAHRRLKWTEERDSSLSDSRCRLRMYVSVCVSRSHPLSLGMCKCVYFFATKQMIRLERCVFAWKWLFFVYLYVYLFDWELSYISSFSSYCVCAYLPVQHYLSLYCGILLLRSLSFIQLRYFWLIFYTRKKSFFRSYIRVELLASIHACTHTHTNPDKKRT